MNKWRTIIMSDLHLGARQSQTDKIIKFLDENESDTLILNGDIIDGWALKSGGKWKNNCSKIFRKFMKRSEKGVKVVYIRGNHDDFLKPFIPFMLNNIEIVRKYVHKGADGRSYYCYHGDVLDFVIMEARWLAVLGGWSYDFVIRFNTLYNHIRRWFVNDDYYEHDQEYLFSWTGKEYYENHQRQSFGARLINEAPIVEILDYERIKKLDSYFGDIWKPIFKKWFENKVNLPIKTLYAQSS